MKQNVLAAAILSVGLIVAAFVHAGRYYAIAAGEGTVVKVDRWTGKTEVIRTKLREWEF